jgi:hypothetical protein
LVLPRPDPSAIRKGGWVEWLPANFNCIDADMRGSEPVPSFDYQPFRPIFAEAGFFVFLEAPEGLGRIIGALHIGGVEDIAQFVSGKGIFAGEEGIEFGAKLRTASLVPSEGWPGMTEVFGPGPHGMRGVSEFQHARCDEREVQDSKNSRRKSGKLLSNEKIEVRSSDFMPG